jgi:hypothetical protein
MFSVEAINIPIDLEAKLLTALSPENLTIRTIAIAKEAGTILLNHAVQACIDSVYSASSLTTDPEHEYERTLALLDSHYVDDQDLEQFIGIDPTAEAVDPHSGREMVLDYAIPIHEGYTQHYFGHNTGNFVVGKPWFDQTVAEAAPIITAFIIEAYSTIVEEILIEAFR